MYTNGALKGLAKTLRAFAKEEDGIALTEYLILLGLLVGGVIVAVTTAGDSLDAAWDSWAGFFKNSVSCKSGTASTTGVSC